MNAVTVCGLVAAVSTTFSMVPQAVKTIKTKDTASISLSMYVRFTFGTLVWLVFGLFSRNLPVIPANAITLVLASLILNVRIKNSVAKKDRLLPAESWL